jgi:hypothetical protein
MAEHGEPLDPSDDPDFISTEGHDASGVWPESLPLLSRGLMGNPDPVFVPKRSTPLEETNDESLLPRYALWSMKYLQHGGFFSRSEWQIRECFGDGNNAVYVMDDSRKSCLISRKVGEGSDGATYCLVARMPIASYEQLVDGVSPQIIFAGARDFSLCAVFDAIDAVSNVSVVESFDNFDDVPSTYLPPHPPVEFEGDRVV